MGEERMISNVRELVAGVERERIWITTIGLMGVIFSVVFITVMAFLDILRPAGFVTTETVRPIVQASIWIFAVCSVVSVIAGVKVLSFIRSWHGNYSNLKAAERELEKRYFDSS